MTEFQWWWCSKKHSICSACAQALSLERSPPPPPPFSACPGLAPCKPQCAVSNTTASSVVSLLSLRTVAAVHGCCDAARLIESYSGELVQVFNPFTAAHDVAWLRTTTNHLSRVFYIYIFYNPLAFLVLSFSHGNLFCHMVHRYRIQNLYCLWIT